MSNIYIQEPPTSGKVLLQTSVGDIDIELWSKEAPKACRNFIQLCLESYYDGTIFHRIVKGFIAQCGDPTGTGHGGDSIYGKPFRDEFHSRLRFNHRGLVAMANAGRDDNASQFFFTMAATPELDKKHTIFGKVAGQTLYNMLKLDDVGVDSDDRPLHPPTINRTKVLHNPFDDITPRIQPKHKKDGESKKKKNRSRATKNFNLLSFGEEAEEDEEEVNKASQDMRKSKSKSSHDLLEDESLSSVPAVGQPSSSEGGVEGSSSPHSTARAGDKRSHRQSASDSEDEPSESESTKAEKAATLERIRKKLKRDDGTSHEKRPEDRVKDKEKSDKDSVAQEEGETRDESTSKLEQLRREAKQLKKEIQGSKNQKEAPVEESKPKKIPQNDVITAYEEERKKYEDRKITKKNRSKRENETLSILAKFQSKLSAARTMTAYSEDEEEEDKSEEEEEEEVDANDVSWMNHKLRFESNQKKVLDANIADEDRYEIFDPRNPLNQRRREASKQAMKDKR